MFSSGDNTIFRSSFHGRHFKPLTSHVNAPLYSCTRGIRVVTLLANSYLNWGSLRHMPTRLFTHRRDASPMTLSVKPLISTPGILVHWHHTSTRLLYSHEIFSSGDNTIPSSYFHMGCSNPLTPDVNSTLYSSGTRPTTHGILALGSRQ